MLRLYFLYRLPVGFLILLDYLCYLIDRVTCCFHFGEDLKKTIQTYYSGFLKCRALK